MIHKINDPEGVTRYINASVIHYAAGHDTNTGESKHFRYYIGPKEYEVDYNRQTVYRGKDLQKAVDTYNNI